MTGNHHRDRGRDEHHWTFNGVDYPTRNEMCAARRAEYVRLLDKEGMNFTQAAHAVGISKRTGKAWRNGRNEKASVDWHRSTMDKPRTLHPRHLSQEERIQIADRLRPGRRDPRHRATAGPRPRRGQPRDRTQQEPRDRRPRTLPRPAEGGGPAQTPQSEKNRSGHAPVG